MAFDDIVAPVNPSTFVLCSARISGIIFSNALSPSPGVSSCFVTSTAVIFSASNVTATSTLPLLPFAVAVYVPGV